NTAVNSALYGTQIPIVHENDRGFRKNTEYNAAQSAAYIMTSMQPFEAEIVSVGDGGWDDVSGLYTININVPADQGSAGANHVADLLISSIRPSVTLRDEANGTSVGIRKIWREAAQEYSNWFTVP